MYNCTRVMLERYNFYKKVCVIFQEIIIEKQTYVLYNVSIKGDLQTAII